MSIYGALDINSCIVIVLLVVDGSYECLGPEEWIVIRLINYIQ